jgi:hypothetical protein
MIGLNLTKITDVSSTEGTGTYKIEFPSLKVVSYCSGASKLANSYLFNLLSKYQPENGVGSNFRILIASPIISTVNKEFALTLISDELDALKTRFIALQNATEKDLPPIEKLKNIVIDSITIDLVAGVTIYATLTTEANTQAYIVI